MSRPVTFTGPKASIKSEWRDDHEDCRLSARGAPSRLSKTSVRCFLLVPDWAKTAQIERLPQRFGIRRQGRAVAADVLGNRSGAFRSVLFCTMEVPMVGVQETASRPQARLETIT